MNSWEKLKTLTGVASAIVLPIVLLLLGNQFSSALKEREVQGKFVEIAVTILKEAPSPANRNLRIWATQVINAYSGVPLSNETRDALVDKVPLPQSREEVSRFQKEQGLLPDGIAGPATRATIKRLEQKQ